MPRPTVLTIGNFDGVHRGHVELIKRARSIATDQGRVIVLAFDPHPLSRLAPGKEPPRLSTFAQRLRWLTAAGADDVVRLEPTGDLLAHTPEQFIDDLIHKYTPTAFVEGKDFHFGKARSGNIDTLIQLGQDRGFTVDVVPPVEVDLTDQTIVSASSSIARWLLAQGRLRDVARVIARHYEIEGVVVRGDQRGRTIGFPTANLRTPLAPPAFGIYAGIATLPDDSTRPAAIHVGPRDTFDSEEPTIEPYILDWEGPQTMGLEEYDWNLRIHFVSWLRGIARFESVDALVEQMHLDVARTRDTVARLPQPATQEISA